MNKLTIQRNTVFLLFITHFSLLILLSCQNPFNPLNTEKPNDGTGYFSLSINGVSTGRTILPVTGQNVFDWYELEFTSTDIDHETDAPATVTFQLTNEDLSVALPVGTWDLHVTAYGWEGEPVAGGNLTVRQLADEEPRREGEPVAEGNLTGIVIQKGATVTRNITLTAIIGDGEGTFRWNIAYPEDVTTASMTITPLDTETGTDAQTLYFTGGSYYDRVYTEDSRTLKTGYYRVIFNLVNNEGQRAMRREILHIYKNMDSFFQFTFVQSHFFDKIFVTSNADSGEGSLRQAINDAPDGSTIIIDNNVGTIALTGSLSINKDLVIEGNGVTITRDSSWTAIDYNSQLLNIDRYHYGTVVVITISRIHFKDGRATGGGGAAIHSSGNLSLESCIFSGNQNSGVGSYFGGAIYNGLTMSVKGCTFYGNSGYYGGAISNGSGSNVTLTLEGNLFYRNTAVYGPVVYSYNGTTTTSNGYNVVDVELGRSGFTAATGDKTISGFPVSSISFRLLSGSEAAGVIDLLPFDYPTVDFYGNPITAPAAAGAVQATANGTGYTLELTVNNSARGSISVTPAPDADGFVSGAVTVTASPDTNYEFAYWLVDGETAGSDNPLSLSITSHTRVYAVFTRTVTVNNFTDENDSANTQGTLRYALTNAQDNDIIRFTEVTAGTSVVRLTSALPDITRSVSIEGNGITITRDSSWTTIDSSSRLLYISGSSAVVSISRVHFKDGRSLAIYSSGNLSLESCIFSANQSSSGGAINKYGGIMSVKGCTFYGNSSGQNGGAIYNNGGTLTLEGNLFYRNTATSGSVVYNTGSTVTSSSGYNVVDVALGTGSAQSGFTAATGDKTTGVMPVSPVSFRLLSGSGAIGVITSLSADYPTVDFYGNPITTPAAAGAVQTMVSGTGYTLELTVNNSARGSISVTPAPDADGFVSGTVTVTASPDTNYEFAYWLVDGEMAGFANPLSFSITSHTRVYAVFTRTVIVNNFTDGSGTGTLRYAITNAQDNDIIRFTEVTAGTSVVKLTGALPQITRSVSIEGNGITITRDPSWTDSQLLYISGSSTVVSISRVHFKDGRVRGYSAAIRNYGNLNLESCIFSGNQNSPNGNYNENYGGAINNSGTMSVKGCTFYGNSSNYGGAIYNRSGTLTLEGNLFYRNTATSSGPVVYRSSGTVTSNGYNVVDVALGTGSAQSGFTAATGDKTINNPPVSPVSFKLLSYSGAAEVIISRPVGYPTVDFYGNPINAAAAAGAVQATVNGSGFILELSINNSAGGSVSLTPAPNADGLVSGTVTITAMLNPSYVLAYWLVNGESAGSANPLSFPIDTYTSVQAVFTRTFTVNNFTDESGSAATSGTLRHAITNAGNNDIIRFTGVTPGASVVKLTSALPQITSSVSIEGNGITITRDSSWTTLSQLLYISGSGAVVSISRVHFKDGRTSSSYGAAIYNSYGNLSLESCIFSGNQIQGVNAYGGAIYNTGTMSIKGCTFYGNSGQYGGAIYNSGTLTLEGNLFYRNTATSGPVVYNSYSGTTSGTTSNGYNVVDVALGTGTNQSGFTAVTGDKTVSIIPVSPISFKLLSGSGAAGVITSRPSGYPTVDFYGASIPASSAAAGAVQSTASGYYLDVSVNNSARGSVSITSAQPNADGLVSGNITITAEQQYPYVLAYWLVNGENRGSANPLSFTIDTHTTVLAVFSRIFTVNNFTDEIGSVAIAGTLRHAITNAQNDDVIRFTGVTPGTSVVRLTSALPQITSSVSIEGNGITITPDSSWTVIGDNTQLLRIIGSGAVVTVNCVHFKDGRADNGAAIYNSLGNLNLESCIFSGNQSSDSGDGGGAIYNNGTMNIKGCTFYGNSSESYGGAIYNQSGTLTLEGNLFYGNTATSSGPVVYRYGGARTSKGYNVVDVGSAGFTALSTDKTLETLLESNTTSPFINAATGNFAPVSGIQNVMPDTAIEGFPATDFFGDDRTWPGAPGAVK